MKKVLLFITILSCSYSFGQSVMWMNNFQSPSDWNLNVAPTGATNGPKANVWAINDDEGGVAPNGCAVSGNSNNTLHITNTDPLFPGLGGGALYYTGDNGTSGGVADGTTDIRASLATGISTIGKHSLVLHFDWIGVGQANEDYAEIEYSIDEGANWTVFWTQTPGAVCSSPEVGKWKGEAVNLPANAAEQTDLRLAFRWRNNNDMQGENPSFAVNDLRLFAEDSPTSGPTASFTTPSLTVCVDDCIDFTDASTGTNINDWAWVFNGADTPTSTTQNPTNICYSTEGTYDVTLTVTDDNGTDDVTLQIEVIDCAINTPPTAIFSIDTTIVCAGDCISLTDLSIGDPTSWYWEFDGGTPAYSHQQNPSNICFDTDGTYDITLTVTNDYGTDQITTSVIVLPLPEINGYGDTLIEMNGTAVLTAEPIDQGELFWTPTGSLNCSNCLVVNASPNITTTYYPSLIGLNGCIGRDTILVAVDFHDVVDVASAFSPNGDGVNDVLNVLGVGIEEIDFKIYNRYGQMIFETDDLNEGWDGTMEGEPTNQGVYIWTLEYTLIDGSTNKKSGNVTLIK